MLQVFKTGEINGFPVSRNPIAWIPFFFWVVILIPIVIVLMPLAVIANLLGLALSRPTKNRDNQAHFIQLLDECEHVHMTDSGINFQHWKGMAEMGEYVKAAEGFLVEAKSKKQGMPHSYWVYLRRLSKFSE